MSRCPDGARGRARRDDSGGSPTGAAVRMGDSQMWASCMQRPEALWRSRLSLYAALGGGLAPARRSFKLDIGFALGSCP